MDYKIEVQSDDNKPLSGAYVYFYNPAGDLLQKFRTTSQGVLFINTELDGGLLESGNNILIQYPGYFDAMFPVDSLSQNSVWFLNKKLNSKDLLLKGGLIALALGAGFLLLNTSSNGRNK